MKLSEFSLSLFISDFRFGVEKSRESIDFIKKHRLWEGFWKFDWVLKFLILIGAYASWRMFLVFQSWYSGMKSSNPLELTANLGGLFSDVASAGHSLFFLSGFKYVVLILVEIIVFHFVRRTLEIKTGIDQDFTPRTFIKAEIRMINIVVRSFILEYLLLLGVGTVMGIFGVEFLKHPLFLLIQAFFLGFAIIDNYNELFGMNIRQSMVLTSYYPGLAVAVGLMTYGLLLIPVLGAFLAPFLVGVAATLAFHELREKEEGWRIDWTLIGKRKKKGTEAA